MDAYLQPQVSCHLITMIIRQRKKDIGERTLGLCTTLVCM